MIHLAYEFSNSMIRKTFSKFYDMIKRCIDKIKSILNLHGCLNIYVLTVRIYLRWPIFKNLGYYIISVHSFTGMNTSHIHQGSPSGSSIRDRTLLLTS